MHVFMHNCYACEFYWFKSDGKLRECHYYETTEMTPHLIPQNLPWITLYTG